MTNPLTTPISSSFDPYNSYTSAFICTTKATKRRENRETPFSRLGEVVNGALDAVSWSQGKMARAAIECFQSG
jgi:hypothetical protein